MPKKENPPAVYQLRNFEHEGKVMAQLRASVELQLPNGPGLLSWLVEKKPKPKAFFWVWDGLGLMEGEMAVMAAGRFCFFGWLKVKGSCRAQEDTTYLVVLLCQGNFNQFLIHLDHIKLTDELKTFFSLFRFDRLPATHADVRAGRRAAHARGLSAEVERSDFVRRLRGALGRGRRCLEQPAAVAVGFGWCGALRLIGCLWCFTRFF